MLFKRSTHQFGTGFWIHLKEILASHQQHGTLDYNVRQTKGSFLFLTMILPMFSLLYYCFLFVLHCLINVVSEVFHESEQMFCVRHMWQNFQRHFKGDIRKNQPWNIARSNTVKKYEQSMEEIKAINDDYDAHKMATWIGSKHLSKGISEWSPKMWHTTEQHGWGFQQVTYSCQ